MMITKPKINIIMSDKRKVQRELHEKKEKDQAEKIIFGIIGGLILLAIIYMISVSGLM